MRDPGLAQNLFVPDLILEERSLPGLPAATEHAGASPLALSVPLRPGLLAGLDGLRLRVDNDSGATVLAGMRLNHGHGAISLTANREVVPPGDGCHLFFPKECFGAVGGPAAWDNVIALILLFSRPKDAVEPRAIRVRLSDLRAVARRIPAGPRLTEAGLARVLAQAPGLASGRRDWGAFRPGGLAGAIPPPSALFFPRDRSGRVLSGTVMGRFVGLPPDWRAGADGQLEWAHFLHRHHFLRAPVRSLRRHPAQALVLAGVLGSWIVAHPAPLGSDGGASPAWETLSVAFRLREWLHLAGAAWNRPEIAGGLRGPWLRSIWEHARHLCDHRGHPGNWRIMEAAALALAGLLFPEFREAPRWAETGLDRLAEEMDLQFFADGGYFEISPLYHALCGQACLEVRETARRLGRPLPRVVDDRLESVFDALAALHRPDFTWPSLNDSAGAAGNYRPLLRFAGRALGRDDFLWIGSRGRQGSPPQARVRSLPMVGLAAVRTGFEAGAHGLLFRTGPAGANHVHGDALSLEYFAHGHPMIVDPGICGYGPGPVADRARSAGVHAMPLVDGSGPQRAALSFQERIRPADRFLTVRCAEAFAASGSFRVGAVRVERQVLFLPDGTVVVRDLFEGKGEHEVAAHWQFMPCRLRVDRAAPAVTARIPGTGGREMVLSAASDWARPEVERLIGAVSLGCRDVPAPAVRFRLRGTLPLALLFVLSPHPPTRPC